MRVAELEGLSDDERAAIFYVSLLAWVGCVADAHEMGKWFGDDMALRADSYLVDLTGLPMMRFMIGHVASGSSPVRRLTMICRFASDSDPRCATRCSRRSSVGTARARQPGWRAARSPASCGSFTWRTTS